MSETGGASHARRPWPGTSLVGGALAVGIGLFFVWRTLVELPLGRVSEPGPGAAPLLLAILLIACGLWSMVTPAAGVLAEADEEEDAPVDERRALAHAVRVIGAVMLAALALGTLGYRLTILAILLFFLGLVERKPLVPVLIISFGLSFGSYLLFVRVMKVPLPVGPFGI